jgi:hypothetical protein
VTVFEGDDSVELHATLPKTKDRKTKYSAFDSKRTMFVEQHQKDAINIVSNNVSDIHECLYNYCVIEEYQFGCVYGNYSNLVGLYKYNVDLESWQKIAIPIAWIEDFDLAKEKYTFANFSIG